MDSGRENPIPKNCAEVYSGFIPSYELRHIIWREIQFYYCSLGGDESAAISEYCERWGLPVEEVRAILDGRALPSQRTMRGLGIWAREIDGRCPGCSTAITLIHYALF